MGFTYKWGGLMGDFFFGLGCFGWSMHINRGVGMLFSSFVWEEHRNIETKKKKNKRWDSLEFGGDAKKDSKRSSV